MAYKDFYGNEHEENESPTEVDAMFYSRPLILPGSAFGALNFFFDPEEIGPSEIETLGNLVAEFLDNYWIMKEKKGQVTN